MRGHVPFGSVSVSIMYIMYNNIKNNNNKETHTHRKQSDIYPVYIYLYICIVYIKLLSTKTTQYIYAKGSHTHTLAVRNTYDNQQALLHRYCTSPPPPPPSSKYQREIVSNGYGKDFAADGTSCVAAHGSFERLWLAYSTSPSDHVKRRWCGDTMKRYMRYIRTYICVAEKKENYICVDCIKFV